MNTVMAWSAVRGSARRQMKLCKEEQSEELVVGLIAPGLPSTSQDVVPPAPKCRHHIMVTQMGDLADEDDLSDELMSSSSEKKRRLTLDQVNYLEMSFHMDLKLEPERKALIAKHLGLRPRQVAIWFQNRRARWKNKQLEQDYESLKASYAAVVQENESMSKKKKAMDEENKRLHVEVMHLTSMLGNRDISNNVDVRGGASPDSHSASDSESALKGGEQPSSKLELASPSKSDVQSEMLDSSGLSRPASQEAIVAFVDQPSGEISSFVACASVKLEADYQVMSPSDEVFINFPQYVNGLHVDDYLFSYEDHMYGFTWNG